jgi:hypothetical protein
VWSGEDEGRVGEEGNGRREREERQILYNKFNLLGCILTLLDLNINTEL